MSRVITFSRTFPSYHLKAGQPTHFVEKVYKSILKPTDHVPITGIEESLSLFALTNANPKHHTIRAGHRWKAGDWFSPRVWAGKPYSSKMIQFAPDIQILKTWDIDIIGTDWYLDGRHEYITGWRMSKDTIALNDGLSPDDFYDWFTMSPDFKKKQEFFGQIICWHESIEY